MFRKQPSLLLVSLQSIFSAGVLYFLRGALFAPSSKVTEFWLQLYATLFAPQLGFVFSILSGASVARIIRSIENTRGFPISHALGASVSASAAAGCVAIVRRSIHGRIAFAAALARSFPNSGLPSEARSIREVGKLGIQRIIQMMWPFPILPPPDVEVTRDIVYAVVDGKRLCLDAIRRRGLTQGANTLLYFHGGGWVLGDKKYSSLPLLYSIALEMGWLVLTANYRLSNPLKSDSVRGAIFPDHLHDCLRAVAWCRSSAACLYGGGGPLLAVGGDSAGGHLACLVGLLHHTPRMRPSDVAASVHIDAVIDLYGVHNPKFNRNVIDHLHHVVLRCSPSEDEQKWSDFSPLWWIQQAAEDMETHAPPAFLIVHGTHDALVPIDDARKFVAALRDTRSKREEPVKVPDIYVEIPGALHAFNYRHTPLTFALSDTVVQFLTALISKTDLA